MSIGGGGDNEEDEAESKGRRTRALLLFTTPPLLNPVAPPAGLIVSESRDPWTWEVSNCFSPVKRYSPQGSKRHSEFPLSTCR